MAERRRLPDPRYGGPERREREHTYDEERARFLLHRDRLVVGIGAVGLLAITGAAIVSDLGDSAVVLALIAAFGGLLGVPTALRIDEARERRRNGDA